MSSHIPRAVHAAARWGVMLAVAALVTPLAPARAAFVNFESGQVRPLALSPDGHRLFAVNTPDSRLEIFDVDATGLTHQDSVPVGLEPVAVVARTDAEVWVVNHVSDSISIVDVGASPPRVTRTLLVGDEPRDLVFAGAGRGRAFVTTAHRGQHRPGDPELTTPGIGRADVWVFDATQLGEPLGGTPLSIVTLFTDTPRALAATPDGATVVAAGFLTGNRTTAIHEGLVCDGGATAPPCNVSGHEMPGGLPAPNTNVDLVPQPEVGLILKSDGTNWLDPIGRVWNRAVRFSLPDKDLFTIDALATPPVAIGFTSGVGTVIYDLAMSPSGAKLYVANTEARNDVRFEGPGVFGASTVRGHLHEARISIVSPGGGVVHRRLNKHIDYDVVPSPADVQERSLATPTALAISADGATLYVAAFGSSKVGVFDTVALEADTFTPDRANQIVVSGGGPSGLALDDSTHRLYVLTRFDDAVSVIDTTTRREIAHVALFDPEPTSVRDGRRFLYDATLTSSNGEASCAACHVFGDLDALGWDLGNPDASVLQNLNPLRPGLVDRSPDFHPMKGPMTTQSLRGLAHHGPMHWRGDRTGGLDAASQSPDAGAYDETAAFNKFNVAFAGLLGRTGPLSDADMRAFTAFALTITYPPNPIRNLDNSLTADQAAGRSFYFDANPSDVSGACNLCHVLDPGRGMFGTDGHSVVEPEGAFKVPHLRNAYQKIGMFGMPHVPSPLPGFGFNATNHVAQGDQVRGFGFTHDGSVDTVFRFLQTRGFNRSADNPAGFTVDAAGDVQRRQVEAFVLTFDSELAPIVGQQVSATAATVNDPSVVARIALLVERAKAGECDLIVTGVLGDEARGWLYDVAASTFRSDRAAELAVTSAALGDQAAQPGQARTYTCVPPGSGRRIGIDRDDDGFDNRDELDAGSDPTNATDTPRDRTPIVPIRGAALTLRDDVTPPIRSAARRVLFRAARHAGAPSGIELPAWDSAGDPTIAQSGSGALLTMYNAAGSGEMTTVALPVTNWHRGGTAAHPHGYRYADKRHRLGPVTKVSVQRNGSIHLTAGGSSWGYTLNEASQQRMAVRFQLGLGSRWCADFPAKPGGKPGNDRIGRFVGAPNQSAPTSCPAVP